MPSKSATCEERLRKMRRVFIHYDGMLRISDNLRRNQFSEAVGCIGLGGSPCKSTARMRYGLWGNARQKRPISGQYLIFRSRCDFRHPCLRWLPSCDGRARRSKHNESASALFAKATGCASCVRAVSQCRPFRTGSIQWVSRFAFSHAGPREHSSIGSSRSGPPGDRFFESIRYRIFSEFGTTRRLWPANRALAWTADRDED